MRQYSKDTITHMQGERTMRKLLMMGAAALVLSGCNSMGIIFGPKVDPSGSTIEKTMAIPLYGANTPALFGSAEDYDLSLCGLPSAAPNKVGILLAPVAATVLNAVGGVVIDMTVQAANDKVKDIRNRASKSWTGDWIATVGEMKATRCIALIRYIPNQEKLTSEDVQMAILLRVISFSDNSFQLSPIIAISRKSLALTKCESHCLSETLGHVSLSIAMTQTYEKSATEIANGAGETITISSVPVSENGKLNKTPINNRLLAGDNLPASPSATKPILYVSSDNNSKVYAKFAVTENGTLSGQDHAEAEIKALGEALGPIAKAELKKKLDKLSANEEEDK